jgi:hypothetical protein
MVAQVLNKDIPSFNDGKTHEISTKFTDLYTLYEYFAQQKFDIYIEEKIRVEKSNVSAEKLKETTTKELVLLHQRFALRAVLDESVFRLLPEDIKKPITKENETTLLKVGIVTEAGGKLRMIHKTFGEFYICKYSIDHVVEGPEHNDEEKFPDEYKKILQLMVQVLLVEDRLKVRIIEQFSVSML